MTDFNQKTHDTDVGSHGGQSRQMMEGFDNQEFGSIRLLQDAELAEKSARLAELDALLNMDDRGNDDPDCEKTTEKPSVLAELRDRAGRIPPMTHRDDEEVAL